MAQGRWGSLGLVLLLVLPMTGAQAQTIGWQEAIARLAAERTRAETCAALLKKHGDEAAKSQGERAYGEAKAEVDGVVAGLVVALAQGAEPASLPELEAKLRRGVAAREADRLKAKTIQTQLEATAWPTFAAVPPSP